MKHFANLALLMTLLGAAVGLSPLAIAQSGAPSPDKVDASTVKGLHLLQKANGVPGRTEAQGIYQEIKVTPDRLVLIDHHNGQRFLMQLDTEPPEFFEISGDLTEYTRGKDYEKLQKQRDETEWQIINGRSRLSEAEWQAAMKSNYLQVDAPPGKRKTATEEAPTEPVEIDGQKYEVKRFVIRENGRVIVDALVTQDIDVTIPFFEFYRRLGAFSNETLRELKKIPGVPLSAKITVVTSTFTHVIKAEAVRLIEKEISRREFELPSGAKLNEDSPYATCEVTGARIEKASAWKHLLTDGRTVYFSKSEYWRDYKKKNREQIAGKKPKPRGPKPPKSSSPKAKSSGR